MKQNGGGGGGSAGAREGLSGDWCVKRDDVTFSGDDAWPFSIAAGLLTDDVTAVEDSRITEALVGETDDVVDAESNDVIAGGVSVAARNRASSKLI